MKTNNINKINSFDIFNYFLLSLGALITIFPLYYVIIVSFARYEDIMKQTLFLFPRAIDFSAYKAIFASPLIPNAYIITIISTVAGTLLSMIISVAGAYAMSKKDLPGRKILFFMIIFTMYFSGGMIPSYLVTLKLHTIDTIWVLILNYAVATFYFIILKNFFEQMPASLEESAKMDGANDIYVLWKIVIPTAAPVIATIALFYSVDKWNEYYLAVLYISNPKLRPLQMVLREVLQNFSQMSGTSMMQSIRDMGRTVYTTSVKMAIVVVTTAPILIVYPFVQKYFTKGIMFGAVKE